MDSLEEDPDIRLQRASAYSIQDLKKKLPQLADSPTSQGHLRKILRKRSLDRILSSINNFQEDPQLLDPYLKDFLPPAVDCFLRGIYEVSAGGSETSAFLELHALSKILYYFCKVRGEKVITRFFNNEPKYVVPMLHVLQIIKDSEQAATGEDHVHNSFYQNSLDPAWERRYILLLWIAHLMLTPFPLSSLSSPKEYERFFANDFGFSIPESLPSIAEEVLLYALTYVKSAMKEQTAAAVLLVRLAGRPDMKTAGLLKSLTNWSLSTFSDDKLQAATVHIYIGQLLTLYRLVSNVDVQDLVEYLEPIYNCLITTLEDQDRRYEHLRSSAVGKRLIFKTLRTLVVHAVQMQQKRVSWAESISSRMLDQMGIIEEVIDHLLKGLGDRDTPVRLAASKALSMITTRLRPEMAEEVVEAVIGSLNEDITGSGDKKSLSSVNPLRWHGLTLTLAHLLFRRVPSALQISDVLNSLFMALSFEQRAATGSSIGANVRDAANFGLWSLSRGYSTKHLQNVDSNLTTQPDGSALQRIANELLAAACLDPEGNVRRGSSAALQELIGRHPDTIYSGISLVQVVDYHAVGLRRRAMSTVAFEAAKLHPSYRDLLFEGLLGWRGAFSGDRNARVYAATGVQQLSSLYSDEEVFHKALGLVQKIHDLEKREVGERHGYMLALTGILNEKTDQLHDDLLDDPDKVDEGGDLVNLLSNFARMWALFNGPFQVTAQDLGRTALKPELAAEAVLQLLTAIGYCSKRLKDVLTANNAPYVTWHLARVEPPALTALNLCIKFADEETAVFIPAACSYILPLLPEDERVKLVETWLHAFEAESTGRKNPGLKLALGSSWNFTRTGQTTQERLPVHERITRALIQSATSDSNVDSRVIAIRALSLVVRAIDPATNTEKPLQEQLVNTFDIGLDDYTTNERGDVGSLVRLETIEAVRLLWTRLRQDDERMHELPCRAAVHRIALEKLDKVRLQAGRCLQSAGYTFPTGLATLTDVSTYDYFAALLVSATSKTDSPHLESILLGISITAGGASDSLIQTVRSSLYDFLDCLPIVSAVRDASSLSIYTVGTSLLNVYLHHISTQNDRILVPLLETTGFLLDTGVLQRLSELEVPFKWRAFLSAVQKSHYKSNNLPKLVAAINVYRGLVGVPQIRAEVMTKLVSMLSHPFSKVRVTAAEALWVITGAQQLRDKDWSGEVAGLKDVVGKLKTSLV